MRRQSLQTPQRQPTSRQARGERNFEPCGRSSWQIGSGSVSTAVSAQRSVVGGRRVYVRIYRHLVNTCTSQAGPLRVKGNQLLPPPPGLHLPRPPSAVTVIRTSYTTRCDEVTSDLTRPWSCFFWYLLLILDDITVTIIL